MLNEYLGYLYAPCKTLSVLHIFLLRCHPSSAVNQHYSCHRKNWLARIFLMLSRVCFYTLECICKPTWIGIFLCPILLDTQVLLKLWRKSDRKLHWKGISSHQDNSSQDDLSAKAWLLLKKKTTSDKNTSVFIPYWWTNFLECTEGFTGPFPCLDKR